MAAVDYLDDLRDLVNEPDAETWSDEVLVEILTLYTVDGVTNISRAAAEVWTRKAAHLSGMVNVTESGSSRSLSQLYDHALSMAKYHAAGGPTILAPEVLVTRTRRIVRPETSTQ
jgi:hypothetical protein